MSIKGRVYDESLIYYIKGHMAMPIKHRNNKTLGRLSKRVSELESAFGQLAKAVRYDASKDATHLYPISAFISQLRNVRIYSGRLQEASNRSGRINSLGADQLSWAY